jgi:RNA polymerase-binding transcription factor DksA
MGVKRSARGNSKVKAATADIIGAAVSKGPVPAKWAPHQARLLELRDLLQRGQTDLARDALEEQPSFSSHMADAGTDAYDRDIALGLLSSEQDALYEIEQALGRIRNGTYGVCELTGKRIEAARLAAIPWTRFTVAAEQQLESQGVFKRASLGPRQSVVERQTASESEEEEEEEEE